jgi:TorA maturation chaperone TorD
LVLVGETTTSTVEEALASEEALRADAYALLATLLRTPPTAETLQNLAGLASDDTELGRAVGLLGVAAQATTVDAVGEEYHDLFIGVGASELKPYASYYRTGFLYEKPLADLRDDMADLGIASAEETSEPEDHIASLCEIMCGLITGAFGAPADLARQRAFFDRHIAPWAAHLFEDLETTQSASFYKPVGMVGRLFMEIESQAFEMAA